MALNYFDDIVTLFENNYTLSYPVAYDDAPPRDVSGSGQYVDQPTNAPWLRVNFAPSDTFQETIGTRATIRKNELFNVVIQVFMPRNSSGSGKVYTNTDFAAVSNHLNTFLVFDSLITTDNALITLDQINPQSTDRSTPGPDDTWQQINLTYRYEYRYI